MYSESKELRHKNWLVRWIRLVPFFSIYLIPPSLLSQGMFSPYWRYPILLMMVAALTMYCIFRVYIIPKQKFTWRSLLIIWYQLGLRKDNFKKSLMLNIVFSFVSIMAIIAVYLAGWIPKREDPGLTFFILYVFISAAVQEFFFRPVVFWEMKSRGMTDWEFIIASSLNFAYLHIFYGDLFTIAINVPLTFVAGFAWAWIYTKQQNFWTLTLSHASVGAIAIVLGAIR